MGLREAHSVALDMRGWYAGWERRVRAEILLTIVAVEDLQNDTHSTSLVRALASTTPIVESLLGAFWT